MKRKGKYVQLEFDFKPWDDEVKCVSLAPYRLFQREVWKDIKGYKGLYQVSNLGRVKSLNYNHTAKEKILKLYLDGGGYPIVCLCKNGKSKFYLVHRLVYETFIGEIPEGMEINHISECKQDNRICNLNLLSHKANNNWGTHNERVAKSLTNHPKTSKPVIQKSLQGELVRVWPSAHEVERQLGYGQENICACCKGKIKTAYKYIWKYEEAV